MSVSTNLRRAIEQVVNSMTGWILTFSGLNVGTATGAVAGEIKSDKLTLINSFSNNEAAFAIDASADVGTSVAQNATYTPFSNSANFSGIFIVHDVTLGGIGVYIQAGGTVVLLGSTGQFSAAQGTAAKINVYTVNNVVTIENKTTDNPAQIRTWAIRTQSGP